MIRGVEIFDRLQSRAYDLYLKENPLPAWASPPHSSSQTNLVSTEEKIGLAERGNGSEGPDSIKKLGGYAGIDPDSHLENADLIDLELRSYVCHYLYLSFAKAMPILPIHTAEKRRSCTLLNSAWNQSPFWRSQLSY
jgi:hypothetical protein